MDEESLEHNETMKQGDELEMDVDEDSNGHIELSIGLAEAFGLKPQNRYPHALENRADEVQNRREARAAAGTGLLIDRELELLGIDVQIYPPSDRGILRALLLAIETAEVDEEHPGLPKDALYYYLLLDESSFERNKADAFARMKFLSVALTIQTRGYRELDSDRFENAVMLLSDPRRFYDDDVANQIILTLASIPDDKRMSALTTSFIRYTTTPLIANDSRDAYLRALSQRDFPSAWNWVRGFGFGSDLRIQKAEEWFEQEVGEEGTIDGENVDMAPESTGLAELEKERKMTLEVLRERKRLLGVILRHILSPSPRKKALQQLLWLQIDPFEQSFLTSYLTDPTSNLSSTSFDLLHDLINMRLLNSGNHSLAIDLDRQITELERGLGRHVADPKARAQRWQLVKATVGVLPEVQREMLALGRNMQTGGSDSAANTGFANGSAALPVVQTQPSIPKALPISASTSFRSAPNPSQGIYQSLLSTTTTPLRIASGTRSPISRLPGSSGGASSRPQATYVHSPFSVPPRIPINPERRRESPYRQYPDLSGSLEGSTQAKDLDDHEAHNEREITPVPTRPHKQTISAELRHEPQSENGQAAPPQKASGSPVEHSFPGGFPVAKRQKRPVSKEIEKPQLERQARQRRPTARAQEAAEPKALRRSTLSRTSAQNGPIANGDRERGDQDGSQSQAANASPSKKRKSHKGPASETEEAVPPPRANKLRQPSAGPPPSPDRQRRTRQSSVASSLASDVADMGRGLRRSARHSLASSPAKSEVSEATGRRRETTGGRQGSATPRNTGIRTRRQAAMSPQAEE